MSWAEEGWERTVPPVELDRAEVDALLGPLGPATRVVPLTAGKANTNLRVDRAHGPPLVMRIYQRDRGAAARERRLWERLGRRVPVPALRGHGETSTGLPVAVVDHVRGVSVAEALVGWRGEAEAVGHALGRALAGLASWRVDAPGLYADDLSLSRRFDSVAHSFTDLIGWSLRAGRARRRLGRARRDRLLACMGDLAERLSPLDDHLALAHGDYKSSNLILQRCGGAWRVAAVLDWEFACPFTPMLDVAILMRHRETFPAVLQRGFEQGYRLSGGWLPDDWRGLSRVVDLMNLVGFLNASGDRPRLYDHVLRLIDQTLASCAGSEGEARR